MSKKLYFIIPFLVLVLVFGFGLASCSGNSEVKISELENELVDKNIEIESLKNELNITKSQLKLANEKIDKLEEEKEVQTQTEVTEEETEEYTSTVEEVEEKFKEDVRKMIEEGFKGKLTKLTWTEDFSTIYLAYNTEWAVEETIQKEVYDITLLFAPNYSELNLDIIATSDRGRIVHAHTSTEIMTKIENLELSYEEWLEAAF